MLLRSLLAQSGLLCLPKVSGSKGLQVYVPLNTPVNYEASRAATLAEAERLQKEHPKLVTAEMAKALRRNTDFNNSAVSQGSPPSDPMRVDRVGALHPLPPQARRAEPH